MKPPIVEVVWIDSFTFDDGWHPLESSIEKRIVNTAGYVVSEDDLYTVVASTWDGTSETFGNAAAILNMCILSKHTLTA